jgi:hypothetical protein
MLIMDNLMFMAMAVEIWSSKDQCVIWFLRVKLMSLNEI